ncbi:MAG: glycosyltransferase family 2 protein [Verrucomicrobiae bacterium]|nr:glycosyltransferase family 2 protein [Verrucomicrobiae bacterium]
MANPRLTFALIMPTLNEVEGMRAVLPRIDRSLFKEIIVVDGHSTDGTAEYAREQGLAVLLQPNRGLTDAQEHAYRHSTADVLIMFTPDGNSLPELLPAVCSKLAEGYDMVIVSRYTGGAKSEDDDLLTAFGNWMFTRLVNFLFGANYTDVLVGFRGYTREAVERMDLPRMVVKSRFRRWFPRMNSWETGSSIRAARLKLKVAEIPGDEPKRIGGVRKLSIVRNGFGVLFQILYDFFFFRPNVRGH